MDVVAQIERRLTSTGAVYIAGDVAVIGNSGADMDKGGVRAWCVLAEVRWRWTLKVLWAAACTERNLCADPTLLNPCILRSRRRVG
jgi:hypothetical protein